MRLLALLLLCTLSMCAPPAYAQDCPRVFAGDMAPVAPVAIVPLCFTSYVVGYAPTWGEPAYSAEHLTADQARAGAATKRFGAFHAESQLPADERITPADYNRTGYDRGHMSPAGDFGADKPDSFSMANMVPQAPNLNRKVWAGIEAAVRQLAITDGELYVITGPEIAPDAPSLAGKVKIPAKTWKAVDDPSQGAGAYVCTNTAAPVCTVESVDALTAEIGFDPFPALPADVKARAMALPEPTKGSLSN